MTNRFIPLFVWWFQFLLMLAGAYWAAVSGVFNIIYEADVTHITQVIAGLFILGTLRVGWLAWKWARFWGDENNDFSFEIRQFKTRLRKHLEEWWFASEQFLALGILGTVVGFAMLFYTTFVPLIEGTSPEQIAQLIPTLLPKIVEPIGTIFFATAVGLISSILLRVQLMLFGSFTGIEDEQYESK